MAMAHKLLVPLICFSLTCITAATVPPVGNVVLSKFRGRGHQEYACNASKSWVNVKAWAELFPVYENQSDADSSCRAGIHYFLPYQDANGGRATWSFDSPGADIDLPPTSTITGRVLARQSSPGNIDELLLQATSFSGDTRVSYIQRIPVSGGLAPTPEQCTEPGKISIDVEYESDYVFWIQRQEPSHSFFTSQPYTKVVAAYFAEGHQHYLYNGSAWAFQSATALLSTLPGRSVIGKHYFLSVKDANGGQPTWETFSPFSTVTGKVVNRTQTDTSSIPLLALEKTSNSGDLNGLARTNWLERLSTKGGLPPEAPGTNGEDYASPYTSIYWFYQ